MVVEVGVEVSSETAIDEVEVKVVTPEGASWRLPPQAANSSAATITIENQGLTGVGEVVAAFLSQLLIDHRFPSTQPQNPAPRPPANS